MDVRRPISPVLGAAMVLVAAVLGALLAPVAQAAEQKLTASDGAAFDQLGFSVAVSGDTMVAGAPDDDVGANLNQGSAYVFVRSGGVWTQQQQLTATDGATDDLFGSSVAIDGNTIVVGAPQDDVGSAYVFVRNGGVWTQQQRLNASDGTVGDFFGFGLAIGGDTIAVGALRDDVGANFFQGSAYVFVRSGGSWTEQQKLTASDAAAFDVFGFSVAVDGDTLVAGAPSDDAGGNLLQGSAYVFVRSGSVWTEQQKLTAGDGAAADSFGFSAALGGDTIVVGARLVLPLISKATYNVRIGP